MRFADAFKPYIWSVSSAELFGQQMLLRCFSQEKDPSNLTCVSSEVSENIWRISLAALRHVQSNVSTLNQTFLIIHINLRQKVQFREA